MWTCSAVIHVCVWVHLMDRVKGEARSATASQAIIPDGCKPLLQLLDKSFNKPFMAYIEVTIAAENIIILWWCRMFELILK